MNIAIVGSRNFNDLRMVIRLVEHLPLHSVIISGGARGVDATVENCAIARGLETRIFLPNWQRYGRGAGIVRNKEIVEACDVLIAFWDGKSKGTKSSIELAEKAKKITIVIKALS